MYYVTGNHNVNTHLFTDLLALFEDCQVHYLSDETRLFNEEISISGLNDPVIGFDINQLNLDDSKFNLVLSHRPELFETYIKAKMDLVLSGHAHGGQFRLPLIGGIIAPNQGFLPDYTKGHYEYEQTHMIVSVGIGDSVISFRLNNPSEINYIHLVGE